MSVSVSNSAINVKISNRQPAASARPLRLLNPSVRILRKPFEGGSMDHLMPRPGPAAKLRVLVVLEGLKDLRAGVHHEGAMLNHRLADGPGLEDKNLDRRTAGGKFRLTPAVYRQALGSFDLLPVQQQTLPLEEIDHSACGRRRRWQAESAARENADQPDADVTFRPAGPTVRRRGKRQRVAPLAGDEIDMHAVAVEVDLRDLFAPEHGEVRLNHLVLRRQVEPDLKQFEGIVVILSQERKHLRVLDAAACGHPLHVAFTIAAGGAHGIGMVHIPLPDNRDGLKPPVRVDGKARDLLAMIHAEPVLRREVLADVSPLQMLRIGSQAGHSPRIVVMVMDAEDEGILNRPLKIQVKFGLDHGQSSDRLLGRKRAPWPESGSDHCAQRSQARQESSAGALD